MARKKRSRSKAEFQDPLTPAQRAQLEELQENGDPGGQWAVLPMAEGEPYSPPEPLLKPKRNPPRFARRKKDK